MFGQRWCPCEFFIMFMTFSSSQCEAIDIVLTHSSHLFSHYWTIYFVNIFQLCLTSCRKADIAPFNSSDLSFSLSCLVFHLSPSLSHPLLLSQDRVPQRRWYCPSAQLPVQIFQQAQRGLSWFVWQTQMPLNSHRPDSLPVSYLLMHYSHLFLHHHPSTTNPLASEEGQPHTSLAENLYSLDVFTSCGQLIETQAESFFFSHTLID